MQKSIAFDLIGWEYLFTFGYSLRTYANGNKRVGIDARTGQVVIEYEVK